METVAVDIDDTLVPFSDKIREEFFNLAIESGDKKYLKGAYADFNEWRGMSDLFDMKTMLGVFSRVHEKQWEDKPYPNASGVLRELAKKYEIKYVTCREERFREHVRTFLFGSWFPKGELVILDPFVHDKKEAIQDCDILIEDRPKTIFEFLKMDEGIKSNIISGERIVFGLWKSHNRNLTDIPNVYLAPTWRGIQYYMKKKGVL